MNFSIFSWLRNCDKHLTFLVTFEWLMEEEREHNSVCFCLGDVDSWISQQLQGKPNRLLERGSRKTTALDPVSIKDNRTCVQVEKSLLTRQHGDADGASLAEWLHRGMLGHASVLSFIHHPHLPQRQLRGRQDPVITLRENDEDIQERVKEWDKQKAGQKVEKIFYWLDCLKP